MSRTKPTDVPISDETFEKFNTLADSEGYGEDEEDWRAWFDAWFDGYCTGAEEWKDGA
ncbi:MAG: hypothetical protein WC208_17090 [Gallionella sp.]